MNYKLAKQLFDAKFPYAQIPYTNPDGSDDPRNGSMVCEPNLSRLIDACKQPDREIKLSECLANEYDGYHWEARLVDWHSKEYGGRSCYEDGDEVVTWTKGKTLKEALTKLWLKLNKK